MSSKAQNRSRTFRTLVASLAAACSAALLGACSGPSANDTFSFTAPDGTTFPPVSDALEIRCGTLDCHGNFYRNMRLFGIYGVRLNTSLVTGRDPTSPDEYQRNYQSVISIEPENFASIVANHGQGFDHWVVVLKGTNAEVHKGGQRMKKGDPTYTCLLSWVTGAVNMDACNQAVALMPPEPMSTGGTGP